MKGAKSRTPKKGIVFQTQVRQILKWVTILHVPACFHPLLDTESVSMFAVLCLNAS